jgi:phosphoglycerol transferase MdoB-like AlkP superfamily enzyme
MPPFVKVLARRLTWVLTAYFFCRMFFFIWNRQMFQNDSAYDIVKAFVIGVRFDISAILLTNALLLLIWFLPARWLSRPRVAILDRVLFGVVNFICLGLNFIDVEFVRFIGKRLSYEYLLLHQDVQQQAFGIFLGYWPFFTALFISTGILVRFYPRFPATNARENWLSGAFWRAAIVALAVLGMRGGFQFKPLHPMDAYFSNNMELALLTLNTPFNMIKTTPDAEMVTEKYIPNDAEVIQRVHDLTEPSRPPLGLLKGFNVVVLVVESLSNYDMGAPVNSYQGVTPFLDELSKKSYFFQYNFANSRRSIEGVPAVLCGIPAFMGQPIIMSDFSNNRLDCLPKLLKPFGYQSFFLHGAHNGSFHMDGFSNIAGFEHFVGRNEFPHREEKNFDPYWGVLDEPMLQYATEILDQTPSPVLLSVFTLSSHNPYWIPPELRSQFQRRSDDIDQSMGYTDYSIRKFFETASKKPWFNKTIFVITGDHIHVTNRAEYMKFLPLDLYRVPLFFYIPGLKEHLDVSPDRITQHIDALPSILDLLGIERKERFLLGQSVFDNGVAGRAYNYMPGSYWYLDDKHWINYNRNNRAVTVAEHVKTRDLHDLKMSTADAMALPETKTLLSIAQYYNQGVINNSFYDWKKALANKSVASH